MSLFEKLERACAAFIERAFARTFPSDVEPAQIARKLVSTMEASTRDDGDGPRAPSRYEVAVNDKDFTRLEAHREYLEREWAQLLRELAGRVGIALPDGEPKVRMTARESVPLGAVDVAAGEEAAPPAFVLRMIEGVSDSRAYPIDPAARIGRGEENEIVLADPSVSRSHALVDTAGAAPIVRDLNSTNGTLLNGRRVTAHELRDGDELTFGNTRMRFEASP